MGNDIDFRALFEAAPDLYLVLDPELRIRAVSDAYAAATMIERDAVLGLHLFEVFPDNPDDPEADGTAMLGASLSRVLATGRPDTMAIQHYDVRGPDGTFETRYWSPRNVPVHDARGALTHLIHRVEDVTGLVALQRREREQQRELVARAEELQDANRALRAANAAKDEFLSRVSHELRTPLTAIAGFAELLTRAELTEEHAAWSATILRASSHLGGLVDEVLDLSRIGARSVAVSLEPVALGVAFQDALDLVRGRAEEAGITLHVPESAGGLGYASADRRGLQQVLINLLVNAIKYNRPGGDVRMRVEGDGGDHVRISVTDTGPGMDRSAVGRLFVAFERLDAGARGIEGHGLGLALSRTLVEAMGGTIGCDSTPGVGTTFWVRLRTGEQEVVERTAPAPLPEMRYAAPRRVLYIEDTVVNVRLIEAILQRRPSIEVLSAPDGGQGLEQARAVLPDLILLDLHLPDMGGREVLDALRADPATVDIPVMILSANAAGPEREPLLRAGARRYLTKPVAMAVLLEAVDELLGVDQAAAAG